MSLEPLETAEGAEHAACRQLVIFVENQVGQLLRVMRLFEGEPIRILGLSVESKVDCAVLRMLVDDPDAAHELCTNARLTVCESELIVVELPPGKRGILSVCSALITGEVNINYAYSAWATKQSVPCLAIHVDDLSQAAKVLALKKFRVLDQDEL